VIKTKSFAVLSCLLAAIILLLVASALMPKALEGPQAASEFVYLPVVLGFPPPPEIIGFDGVERDWQWLTSYFGNVQLERGYGSGSVQTLKAIRGPASITVWVANGNGDPVGGVPVVFYWPDAPHLEPDYQACGLTRGIIGWTEPSGKAGFGVGGGSYYFPPNGGTHTIWIGEEGTDCLSGIGLIGLTEHEHLDSYWTIGLSVVNRDRTGPAVREPPAGFREITSDDGL
jgi:hypothetical protein